jgi:hypothetical protein
MTSFSLPQKEVGRTMTDRLRFITHQGKQILLIDLSNCPAAEVEKIFRAVPDLVTARPRGSVLILSDFTGASFDEEAMRVIKETALFDKHFVKKSAWTGAETISKVFFEELTKFSRRSFSVFKTREAALAWLVKDWMDISIRTDPNYLRRRHGGKCRWRNDRDGRKFTRDRSQSR